LGDIPFFVKASNSWLNEAWTGGRILISIVCGASSAGAIPGAWPSGASDNQKVDSNDNAGAGSTSFVLHPFTPTEPGCPILSY